jgi:hypothetical protein
VAVQVPDGCTKIKLEIERVSGEDSYITWSFFDSQNKSLGSSQERKPETEALKVPGWIRTQLSFSQTHYHAAREWLIYEFER